MHVSFLQVICAFFPYLELYHSVCLAPGIGRWNRNRFGWIFSRF